MSKSALIQLTLENSLKGWREKRNPDQVGFSFETLSEEGIQVNVLQNGKVYQHTMSPLALNESGVIFTDGNDPETTMVVTQVGDELSFQLFEHEENELYAYSPAGTISELIRLIEKEQENSAAGVSGEVYAVCVSGNETGKLVCFDWAYDDGTVEWMDSGEAIDLESKLLFQVLQHEPLISVSRSDVNEIESKTSVSYELGVLVGFALESKSDDMMESVKALADGIGKKNLDIEKACEGLATQRDITFSSLVDAKTWLTRWLQDI